VDVDLVGSAAGDRHLHQVAFGVVLQQGEGVVGGQIAGAVTISGLPDQ
jgi:hypothetical protein